MVQVVVTVRAGGLKNTGYSLIPHSKKSILIGPVVVIDNIEREKNHLKNKI